MWNHSQLPGRVWLSLALAVAAVCLDAVASAVAADVPPLVAPLENKRLVSRLKEVAKEHSRFVRAEKVLETAGDNEVWRVELGAGNPSARRERPAMLVVAGIEGNDLAGSASALAWIESLARQYPTNDRIRALLDSTTIHVWPRVNPDAARHYFTKLRVERATNDRVADDDRDGATDEDGPEDLNGDGLVTAMRVEDPAGEYILDPVDARLLAKADRLKGERGAWRLFTEGRDNDGDEEWNEDPPGGVNFNRNFPYAYKFFAPGAGRHQVSEPETRALAEFVIAHPEIGVVFTFGAADNLLQTPKGEAPKRPPTALHEEDVAWFRELGKAWRDQLGLKKELGGASEPGSFSDWMYFHRGRLSLAARPWSPAMQLELAKAPAKDARGDAKKEDDKKGDDAKAADAPVEKKPAEKGKEPDSRNEEERAFLKWADQHATNSFVAWRAFEHPDFPGKRVEIGGLAPFATVVPPADVLPALAAKQGGFLTDLAGRLPRIAIRKVEVKALGEGVLDITAQIENTGYLPTATAQGQTSREIHLTRATLKVDASLVLSGERTAMLGPIPGGGMREARWVLRAKESKAVTLEVISMIAGRVTREIELKAN